MKVLTKYSIFTYIVVFLLNACEKVPLKTTLLTVHATVPENIKNLNPKLLETEVSIKNINTGELIKIPLHKLTAEEVLLEEGFYSIMIEGKTEYSINSTSNKKNKKQIRGILENIEINGKSIEVIIELFLFNASSSFVISEIFFADTQTPDGKQYGDGDQYIEIYNNSDKILYADGLCIAETELNTALYLNEYTPDVRPYAVPITGAYRIPGNGTDHPVKPGETILICDIAIDHTQVNANSFDLSKADYEWYDNVEGDVDVPEVPNLEVMVSFSNGNWHMNNRGWTSYILFKLDKSITPEIFTKNFAYYYKYHFIHTTFDIWMDFNVWKIPNELVIDAVECSTPSEFQWKALDPSLDLSWTHSGDGGDERYGKSVKRKISYKVKGRSILLDTNDSKNDFIHTAEPSPGIVE